MKIVLRAEAAKTIGSGHVVRCLTLGADLITLGHDVMLSTSALPRWLEQMARKAGVSISTLKAAPYGVEDAQQTLDLSPDLIVVDGYEFGSSYFETLGNTHHVVLDDNHETKAVSPDVVINVNPHATVEMYRDFGSGTKLLIGLKYALIRSEIRDRVWTPSDRYVVSIGGSDVFGLTDSLAYGLVRLGASVSAPHRRDNEIRGSVWEDADPIERFEPSTYPDVLASSGFAIVGAGGSMWEVASLGVPSVALVVADNQVGPARAAEQLGITCSIDVRQHRDVDSIISRVLEIEQSARVEMSRIGPEVVDGKGSMRVIEEICG